ncbi:C2H2-like zinc finger protein [Euphorbia peplus]|nr:C2H2-like zinc finger protein [Euphorbia peplus]
MDAANPVAKKKLFICKFCNKRYPCGKSLGGHIRIHLSGNGNHKNVHSNSNSNSADVEDEADLRIIKGKDHSDTEGAGQSAGYGLRENPKKTRRFMADSNKSTLLQGKVCKECGKGFQSLKALCGHMASHSKTSFEDQVFDSQSDTETSSAPSKRRRSTRGRYKSIDVYSSSSLSLPNASVSSVDIEHDEQEQEQEEVAMCLMMLSKDSGFRGCFSSIANFSDDNSVVVETKSSSKLRISVKNGINCVYNANGVFETKKSNQSFENSDSGYFRNGPKKVRPEVPVHGFDELKKQKSGNGCSSRYEEESSPEMGKRLSRYRRIKTDLGKDRVTEGGGGYDESNGVSRKRGKNNDSSYNAEALKAKASKTGKFHRTNGYESGENSIDVPKRKTIQSCNGKSPIVQNAEQKLGLKKGKVHECPFCYKVFRSGQALGGHKRSHFVGGGSEDRTVVIDHQVPEVSMSGLIDLNLPAPIEEDTNGYYLASW